MPENTDSPRGEHWPVCVEILEAEDVKEADGLSDLVGLPGRLVNGRIDFVHHPNEKTAVNSLADHKENHFCHKVCPPKHNRFPRTHTVNYQQNKNIHFKTYWESWRFWGVKINSKLSRVGAKSKPRTWGEMGSKIKSWRRLWGLGTRTRRRF